MNDSRVILHCDLDCFYAAVEINENPALRGKCVAVCGSTENRHGIVLAKSYEAKRYGVKTGQANWEAQSVCPGLICVPPHYDLYLQYSQVVRDIYRRYADNIEPFGMDENWVDLELCHDVNGVGAATAREIQRAVKSETGLSVSIGASFSKIFAKLGSDMNKPHGITLIDRDCFREKVWPLPVSDLLYVGPATTRKLRDIGCLTIGDLAQSPREAIKNRLGKNGIMLWQFANGADNTDVMPGDYVMPVKSVGHGTTCVCDLESNYPVWRVLYELAQDVGQRLRQGELAARGVALYIRDKDLGWEQHQTPLSAPSQNALEIASAAFALFRERYLWQKPVRALTVSAINLISAHAPEQLDLFGEGARRLRRRELDGAIDDIRRRYGYGAIRAASLMGELAMAKDRCEDVIMPAYIYRG